MLEENAADSKAQGPDIVGIVHSGSHDEDPAPIARLARAPHELNCADGRCYAEGRTQLETEVSFHWLKSISRMAKRWKTRCAASSAKSCKRTSSRRSSGTLSI